MKIIKISVFALIISSLLLCCISCGGRGNETQSEPESTEATATEEPVSDWDAAAVVWKAGTDLDFELRVRPGVGYTASERDFDCCDFDVGGKTVSVKVEGMDYVNTFDQLVAYFESLDLANLLVSKTTQTVIADHGADGAEIVTKLDGMHCLTVKAPDVSCAEEFFSDVMMRVGGEDYDIVALMKEFTAY